MTSAAPGRSLAGVWTRGGALAIDLLIMGAIELVLFLIVWSVNGSPLLTVGSAERLAFEVGLPVAVLYAPLLLGRPGAQNGQTIGKRAMGIRVVREDGRPLTFATAVVRETLGRQLPAFITSGLYLPVDYLWPLWDGRRQALHDKIGRTLVIRADASPPVAGDAAAPSWGDRAGTVAGEQTFRGDWLPPVAPTPDSE